MKVVVITGASDGIGAEAARQWAGRDGNELALVLAARNDDKLQAAATQCRSSGAAVLVQRCDGSWQADCMALIDAAAAAFGGIDMRINLWGSVWCTHAALPHLKARRGRIVAVASLAGLVGVPGRTAYSADKFAMVGFFESLRTKLFDAGMSVTIAEPGVVATETRRCSFSADGHAAGRRGLDEAGALNVQTCAHPIVGGAENLQRAVVMSAKGKILRWLKLLAPRLVDRMALRALNKEGR